MADIYFTSDTHSYIYPTDYVSRGKKDMGYMVLASSFSDGAIIADGGDVLQAVVTGIAAADFQAHRPGLQVEFIVYDEDLFGLDFVV